MIIDRSIAPFIVFCEDSILNALAKISSNKSRIVFSVTESGRLDGVLSDGDFRRWIIEQRNINLNQPVSLITNKAFVSASADHPHDTIRKLFNPRVQHVPLIDDSGHLVAIAHEEGGRLSIGGRAIGDEDPVFVIAEIGNNHQGSVDLAKRMIDAVAAVGVDCVKFQMRHLDSLYRDGDAGDEDLGSEYTLDLLRRFNLDPESLFAIFDHSKQAGLIPLCTPWDHRSLRSLEDYGIDGYKIASADLTNHDLLQAVAATGKPMLCSTGMTTEDEIVDAVGVLRRAEAQFALLHCNSTYPTPYKSINLNYMDRLREIGDCPVGYSGHELGISVAHAAVAKGARIIEKHFTLDRGLEGNDHKVSLLPEELRALVAGIREIEDSMGTGSGRSLCQGELINREVLAKSLVAASDIRKGQTVVPDMIAVKSPGRGLPPYRKVDLIGKVMPRDLKKGEFFAPDDLGAARTDPRPYAFHRPFGVPVRYHDFIQLLGGTNLDLVEFHLSYADLDRDFHECLSDGHDLNFVVHCPELFAGDHILDLASPDDEYRRRSIEEVRRTVAITRAMTPLFRRAAAPLIVVNAGGWSTNGHRDPGDRPDGYDRVRDSLDRIDAEGVELIIQTMPPFPWHFGGQRYHNLFVDPEEIGRFCEATETRICLDTSHSKLACNHYGWSFKQFLEHVGARTAHMHLADAAGVDGEGLQIGDGDIDFAMASEILTGQAPMASFIPEVWQSHKNDGEGMWVALDRLEQWF